MTTPDVPTPEAGTGLPHEFDHTHSDVSGGWLRAASFGAMDGLVTNTALIAGVAAAANTHAVVLSGIAGLLAGSFSMALGEYTSVTTANEQLDSELRLERRAFRAHPEAEMEELVQMLVQMGMSEKTARVASEEIHEDETQAVNFHMVAELGVDPREKPSARLAAISSFVLFAIGAVIPLIPYLLGFDSLVAGVVCGSVGLLVAGGVAGPLPAQPGWGGAPRPIGVGGGGCAAGGGIWV